MCESYTHHHSQPLETFNIAGEPEVAVQADLNVTEDDLLEAKEIAASLSLEEVRTVSPVRGFSPGKY